MIRRYLQSYAQQGIPNAWVINTLLEEGKDLTSRSNTFAHVTASAFIVDSDHQNALLIHHAGLDLWLMPGGHVDEGETPLQAAIREAEEEVGLTGLTPVLDAPVDCDVHLIPVNEKKNEGSHWHVDFRFLLVAPAGAAVELNTVECLGSKWIGVDELISSAEHPLKNIAQTLQSLI